MKSKNHLLSRKPRFYLVNAVMFIFFTFLPISTLYAGGYRGVTFATEDGGTIEGSLFEGSKNMAVVFAHGAAFNKESWYSLAERLQKEGITSLPFDFRGYGHSKGGSQGAIFYDVLGAIAFLEREGFARIALVGGSMGGAAVLEALQHTDDRKIKNVVLLAPAGGSAVKSAAIKKLFVVSEKDGLYSTVSALYQASSQPKELKVYPGAAHAQNIFQTEYGNDLTRLILGFLGGGAGQD